MSEMQHPAALEHPRRLLTVRMPFLAHIGLSCLHLAPVRRINLRRLTVKWLDSFPSEGGESNLRANVEVLCFRGENSTISGGRHLAA